MEAKRIGFVIQSMQWAQSPGQPAKNPNPLIKPEQPEKPEKEKERKEIENWPSIGDPHEYQGPLNHTENSFSAWEPNNR